DPARGNHRFSRFFGYLDKQVSIWAGQGTVFCDVRDDITCTASFFELFEHVPDVATFFDPTAGRKLLATHVEAYSNLVTIFFDHLRGPCRVFQGSSAKVDACGTHFECFI